MSDVRALRRQDLPAVASLIELAFRTGSRTPSTGLASYLERILLDHPWFDAEIPSLVSVDDDGRIIGFLGSHVRRFLFDGKPIRLAVSGQLVADPTARRKAVGAFLLKRFLDGPQDVTITDTASETVRRMWEGLGGETLHLGRVGWLRLFRPIGFASGFLLGRRSGVGRTAAALSAPLDGLAASLFRRQLEVRRPRVSAEALTPDSIVANLPAVAADARLRPDYDIQYLDWLFNSLAAVTSRGSCEGRLIRHPKGRILGWYLYLMNPGGISQVIQIAAREQDVDDVMGHLFHDARETGATALQGRVEPPLVESLSKRHCLLHVSGYRILAHAREEAFLQALHGGNGMFSRLDGDWWMGVQLEPTTARRSGASRR